MQGNTTVLAELQLGGTVAKVDVSYLSLIFSLLTKSETRIQPSEDSRTPVAPLRSRSSTCWTLS